MVAMMTLCAGGNGGKDSGGGYFIYFSARAKLGSRSPCSFFPLCLNASQCRMRWAVYCYLLICCSRDNPSRTAGLDLRAPVYNLGRQYIDRWVGVLETLGFAGQPNSSLRIPPNLERGLDNSDRTEAASPQMNK